MKRKIFIPIFVLITVAILVAGYAILNSTIFSKRTTLKDSTITSTVKFVESTIVANGVVTAQNQANLAFQTSGKVTYLPFKEGDKVKAGQTIAKLDTYALQRQLTVALNNYRITRDNFDQTQVNSQNNVLYSQQSSSLSKINTDLNNGVNDAIRRIVDQSQAGLDNSVASVELANYAIQLSTLTSPISGIITREDINVAGVNITPATTFVVKDPASMVFRANIPTQNIYYISVGSAVTLAVDGISNGIQGTVERIYPSKVVLANGQAAYQVDIVSDDLRKLAKFDETGTAIINTNASNVALVPAWTVLAGKYVWIEVNGVPQLKEVVTGKVHDNEIEIVSGLSPKDKIIINPKDISVLKYSIL